MNRAIAGLFSDPDRAAAAMEALERAGIPPSAIGVVASEQTNATFINRYSLALRDAEQGAGSGAVVGGIAGLLIGLTPIAVPGVGAALVGGWIVATLAGAAVGAAVGSAVRGLADLGLPSADATRYEERIRCGAVLVTVRAGPGQQADVRELLRRAGAEEVLDQLLPEA
jgi:hypothetical protein